MRTPICDVVAATLAEETGIVAVWVFGSVAKGRARPDSDVDVGVLFEKRPAPVLGGVVDALRRKLDHALGREIDLIVLDDAPADLVHRVLRDGVLVIENDRSRRIAFEVQKRNEYFDLLPILRRYRKARVS